MLWDRTVRGTKPIGHAHETALILNGGAALLRFFLRTTLQRSVNPLAAHACMSHLGSEKGSERAQGGTGRRGRARGKAVAYQRGDAMRQTGSLILRADT
jgi:hypothetical protein